MGIVIHCKYDELKNPSELIHDSIKNKVKPLKLRLNDVVEIEMNNKVILLNRKYLPIFTNFNWFVQKGRGQTDYLMANVVFENKKRMIGFHQMILGIHDNLEIDHINGNGLDNRYENLRIVTHQINQSNQRKQNIKSTSKYYGVSWCKRDKKWQVHCAFNNNRKNVGRFSSEIEAAIAYNNYLIKNNIPKALNNV